MFTNRPRVFFPPEPAVEASPDPSLFVLGPLLREKRQSPSALQPKDDSDAESEVSTEVATDVEEEGTALDGESITREEQDVVAPLSQVPKTPGDRKLLRLPSTGQRDLRCKRDVKRGFPDQEPPSPSPPVGKKKKVLTKRMPVWCTSRALVACETGLRRAPASHASDLPTSSPFGGKRSRGYEADDEREKPNKKLKAVESDDDALDTARDATGDVEESQVPSDGPSK
ncbi:uncharacterized protein EV420DRAFT_1749864 [Desarmillaria tabescens]|uniref:Uncharacterized protein n=1 Tax=Armillaria tabescens TaxID=1929756 RepID=A0AA39K1F0_ARMTA|nr:uncharacterized protein EV420DRAFT_1749864 [Desarmillaria tabescens]KAK0452827.1 hypothetical protein EV420DRAFT_1749864 [Desarmillaria tabescens]